MAASTRTSTEVSTLLPRRRSLWSSSTRSSLACVPDRHLADFVEQQGAAFGQFEAAGAAFERAGERAFFVAEDFALDQRFGNGRAIDRERKACCGADSGRGWCAPPVPCRCRSRR